MTSNPIATGWLNENALREYPIHEGCGMRPNDSAGVLVASGWSLPTCLLVDMSISLSGKNSDPFLYLGQMSVVGGSVTLAFCDRDGSRVFTVYATTDEDLDNVTLHTKNASYEVSGIGSFSDARGVVTLGDLDEFFEMTPEGVYTFSSDQTRIEPSCIRYSISGVRSIKASDSYGYMSAQLQGDVNLVAGDNIRFDYRPDDNALVVSADPNSGYTEECDCNSSDGSSFVRSINGIQVEDVVITGDECVEVTTDNGVIKITDTCSKPCCGCAETTFINQTINNLQTSVSTLTNNVSTLGNRLAQFMTSYVLGRKTLS